MVAQFDCNHSIIVRLRFDARLMIHILDNCAKTINFLQWILKQTETIKLRFF